MLRAMVLAAAISLVPGGAAGQALSVLHIKVVLVDAEHGTTPVPRHRLLISDNPATAAPRLIVTGPDGTADVKLRPGNYTVESDRPVAFHGKSYQWTQTLDVPADREAILELTVGNADVTDSAADAANTADAPLESDPEVTLPKWQDSVVGLWTPTAHASGFVIDAKGLIATSQRVVGTATSIEVQFTPSVKVAASVLVADRGRDVAVLWVDPKAVASTRPVPLGCAPGAKRTIADGQKIFTISSPLREAKDIVPGTVKRVDPHRIVSDFDLANGGAGGPVFSADGTFVGITSVVDEKDQKAGEDAPVVRAEDACEVVAAAAQKVASAAPPAGAHLPVEPDWPLPAKALEEAAAHRAGSLNPYQVSSTSFDMAFITPVMTYGAQHQARLVGKGPGTPNTRKPDAGMLVRPLMDFGNWSEYAEDYPPVLLVRVSPKQVEGFWTTVARAAAQTQGASIPPIKHFNGSFLRMRAYCGTTEVTPIHPFKIEQRVSETDTLYEGLYVFDPSAFGPQCGTVKFSMYSEKEPEKEDVRAIDPRVVQQIWQDFEPYRSMTK